MLEKLAVRIAYQNSRQLIKFPITPNMVSLFTLGVSFLAGTFFALGGRGNMLLGAILSVFASILDGSDGEVARLTLQDSAFGCWLETFCDYLYYVFIFAGMMIGLLGRGPIYLVWSTVLLFGAVASFLTTALQRRRMAALNLNYAFGIEFQELSRERPLVPLFTGMRRFLHGHSQKPGSFVSGTSPRSGSRIGTSQRWLFFSAGSAGGSLS